MLLTLEPLLPPAIVQDATMIAILRLVAECEAATLDPAREAVQALKHRAGPRIGKVCSFPYLRDQPYKSE